MVTGSQFLTILAFSGVIFSTQPKKFPRVDFANGILTAGFAYLQDLIWVIERDGTIKLLEPSSGQVVRSLPDKVEPADYRAIAAKDYVLGVAQDSITVFSTRRFQSSPQEYQR